MGNTNKKCTISNSETNKSSASLFCIIIPYSDHFYIHLALFVVRDFDELREILIT